MKFLLAIFILSTAFFANLDRYFFKHNGSFCPKFVIPKWSRCPHHETPQPSSTINEILNQPFTYLTKGKQSFVFRSHDGKWVLKFLRLPRYARRFELKARKAQLFHFRKTLEGCKGAYADLSNETKVVYSHLKPTSFLNQQIHLIDLYGREHLLESDDVPFIIQKHGTGFFRGMNEKNPKALLHQTVLLLSNLYEKGYVDRDAIFEKNYGVVDDEPFIMDIGQLEKCQTLPSRVEYLQSMTESLSWKLQCDYPDLYPYYKNLLR